MPDHAKGRPPSISPVTSSACLLPAGAAVDYFHFARSISRLRCCRSRSPIRCRTSRSVSPSSKSLISPDSSIRAAGAASAASWFLAFSTDSHDKLTRSSSTPSFHTETMSRVAVMSCVGIALHQQSRSARLPGSDQFRGRRDEMPPPVPKSLMPAPPSGVSPERTSNSNSR